MPFRGAERWNERRYVNPKDEWYFEQSDLKAVEKQIRADLNEFIEALGGRKAKAKAANA